MLKAMDAFSSIDKEDTEKKIESLQRMAHVDPSGCDVQGCPFLYCAILAENLVVVRLYWRRKPMLR